MAIVEDFTIMLNTMGENVVYTPGGGGDASTIRAVVDTAFENQEEHPQRGTRFATATITVSASDVTPHHRDIFNIRGYDWEVSAGGWVESMLNESSTKIYKGSLARMIE